MAGKTPDQKLLIGLLLLVSCLYSLLARDTYGGDFRAYYVAALASHDGLDPYVNQVNVNERYADGELLRKNSRFIYPPSALLFFAPLGRLPYRLVRVAFSTGMALLMVVMLIGLSERYPKGHWFALGLFLSLPMAANVDGGQVDILILALTLSAFYARRAWVGGACLGVAIAIKLFPVLVLLWLVANRRWRTAGWAIGVSGTLTLAAVKIWGLSLYREFWTHLTDHLAANPAMLTHTFNSVQVIFGRFVVMGASTYSLHYFYGTRQNPLYHLGAVGSTIGLALVLGYLAWVVWNKHGKALPQDASFFGFLVMTLFANRLLWPAGLVFCFPLIMLLVERSRTPVSRGLLLLAPFFLPLEVLYDQRFGVWLVMVAVCLVRDRRMRVDESQEDLLKAA